MTTVMTTTTTTHSFWPLGKAFEVQADFTANESYSALSLIKRAWGTLESQGPSAFAEMSRYDGTPAMQLGNQHDNADQRWSSYVGALLQDYVLGITPTSPGFATWRMEPHGADLRWAQGRVPTSRGPLSAWWELHGSTYNPDGYTTVVSAPDGTTGEVDLPVPHEGRLEVDGRKIWPGTAHGDGVTAYYGPQSNRLVVQNLPAGPHLIDWQRGDEGHRWGDQGSQ